MHMPNFLLLGLRGLDGGHVQGVLVLAALKDAVGEGVESLLFAVELAEVEPEADSALGRRLVLTEANRVRFVFLSGGRGCVLYRTYEEGDDRYGGVQPHEKRVRRESDKGLTDGG